MKTNVLLASIMVSMLTTEALADWSPTLSRDASTGVYTITYTDETGVVRSVRFRGVDEVAPEIGLALEGHASPFQYNYRIKNGNTAHQAMFSVKMACESTSVAPSNAEPIRLWNSVRAKISGPFTYYCRWLLFDPVSEPLGLAPGHEYTARALRIRSAWLPGMREGMADGTTEGTVFPGFRDEAPEGIHDLFQSTQSPLKFMTVSPKYPPDVFSDPLKGVGALRDELVQACSIGWVSPEGICNSLSVKLEGALGAATAGDRKAVGQRLETYAAELKAQSGKHVAEIFANAMIFDVQYLLGVLQ